MATTASSSQELQPRGGTPNTADLALVAGAGRGRALLWITTATLTGAIVMAMELTAFRLYAPYFGNSIYVWGSMISVVMVALSAGYALGGWSADRWPTDAVLYFVVLGSGIYQLAIVFVARAVLLKLWTWNEFTGPVTATLIIFGPPMSALAMCSPFVIRLLARAGHVGITVGKVFALSTVGSIAGVLGTSFYLVPRLGTRLTMEILCAVSVAIGAAGLMLRRKAAVTLLIPAGLIFAAKIPAMPPTFLWTGNSAYNSIAVREVNGLRYLILNHARFAQTIEKIGSPNSGSYQDAFALGPLVVPGKKLLVLGVGAGGSIKVSRAVAPELDVDAVEIDPQVVQVAQEYFELPRHDTHVRLHVADARPWLAQQTEKWDIVHVDLFQGGPYVPFYLTTVEFFQLARSRMADGGVLMLNVYDVSKEQELMQAMGATLRQVFPSVEVFPMEGGNNRVVFAFAEKKSHAEVVERLRAGGGPAWVRELAERAEKDMVEFEAGAGATIFTDDKAPVEEMTRRMLVEAGK